MSTQDTFEPPHHCGIPKDLITDLDRFTFDIRQRMIHFLKHFTSEKYCPFCEKVIKISHLDDTDDYDIHMHTHHNDELIIKKYLEIWKQIRDSFIMG